ncbi:MipA/OmpV family protein [Marinagarivorans algicola]|uniref:MipA/OmpV family protein n=1 Tax=Marinagarivorans algicola TaxID=1513270 RepID=UPI0009EC2A16|nr:MipA/OmpV family protein [Marinagarivorans algicola]
MTRLYHLIHPITQVQHFFMLGLLVLSLALLMMLFSLSIQAEESSCQGDCVPVGKWDISVSVGLGIRTNPVIKQKNEIFTLVPKISYYGKRFFFENYDIGYTLIDQQAHQFNAILISSGFEQVFFNNGRIHSIELDNNTAHSDTPVTDHSRPTLKLHKRRTAGLSGFEYTYIHPNFDWQTQILQDVTHIHDGHKVRTAITVPWVNQKSRWAFSTGATWQSQQLIDYYYGVDDTEVYDASKAYHANASTAFYIKAQWERPLSQHWGLRALVDYKWLGSSVTRSPIIQEDALLTAYFAGVYHF